MKPDKLLVEARARIIWGESSSAVSDFLVSNGISATDAATKVKEFNLERNRELRRFGLRNIFIGALLAGAAGTTMGLLFPLCSGFTSVYIRCVWPLGIVVIYGLWKVVNGIINLVWPQSEHKSIPDITE
jgi:uncharacterized protein YjeT (DUF2065 family)